MLECIHRIYNAKAAHVQVVVVAAAAVAVVVVIVSLIVHNS